MLGEWQVVTTTNNIISIEKFKLDVDKIYPSVASMKADTELAAGRLVQTEGYWDKSYGGSAYYDIVSSTSLTLDNGKCIQLDNGLYAELHAINDTVTVNQFGAYGDGEHDDAGAIQLALNTGYGNVSFENEKYKIDSSITLSTNQLSMLGNTTTLFSTNDFTDNKEWLVIIRANDINMFSVNIEARETKGNIGYSSQLYIGNCSNINIYNCSFVIPETASSDHGYSNIDCYTGWHNVIIENCDLTLVNDAESGGCIWIRDLQDKGCDTLIFRNTKK